MSNGLPPIFGLHHVTAVTADAQANVDFYAGLLGQRLVKVTVNFDDPSSYHLYYGDDGGRPGTILTFFAWHAGRRGRAGVPQATATAYRIAAGSLPAWAEHLARHGVTAAAVASRPGEQVLAITDPDGMRVELVDVAPPGTPAAAGPLAATRFHGVTLSVADAGPTAAFLTGPFAARPGGAGADGRVRFHVGRGDGEAAVDVLTTPDGPRAATAPGTVHHVAWRVADDAAQAAWLASLNAAGHGVSPMMDRTYFHSIYFREPGGVLFEIATDGPGFAVDEPAAGLGTGLCLPPWFENRRSDIEASLPTLRTPSGTVLGRK